MRLEIAKGENMKLTDLTKKDWLLFGLSVIGLAFIIFGVMMLR